MFVNCIIKYRPTVCVNSSKKAEATLSLLESQKVIKLSAVVGDVDSQEQLGIVRNSYS